MGVTTIILADDHRILRQGVKALLEAEPGFRVVGEAADGLEAAQLVERLQPDVLLLDLAMPGLGGLEVTRQVSQRSPRTRVLILSMHDNEAYVVEALRNGAAGYLLKNCSAAELLQAVREVAAGNRYLSPPISERTIEAYIQLVQNAKDTTPDRYETLTAREREVLHLAADGCTNTEIAARLGISPRTAETHRTNMMRKLRLRNQTDLVRYALRRGILQMEG